jgi:hypothetical protein
MISLNNAPIHKYSPLALFVGAAVAATTAIVVLFAHPIGGAEPLQSAADYVFTALLIPFALALLAVLGALRLEQAGHDGRLGLSGLAVTAFGLAGLVVSGLITLVTADPHSTGPIYPISMLVSIIGLVLYALGSARARVLPPWIIPAITAAWILGGPLTEGAGSAGPPFAFNGSTFILAGTYSLAALALARRERPLLQLNRSHPHDRSL